MMLSKRHFFRTLMRPYRYQTILLLIISLISAFMSGFSIALIVPLLGSLQNAQQYTTLPIWLQPILALFEGHPIEQLMLLLIGAILGAVFAGTLFYSGAIALAHSIATHISADLRLAIVDLYLSVDAAYMEQGSSGKHLDDFMTSAIHAETLFRTSAEFFVNATVLLVLWLLMWLFSWQYTLVTLIGFGLILLLMSRFIHTLKNGGLTHWEARSNLSSVMSELLGGLSVVRTLAQEHVQREQIRTVIVETRNKRRIMMTSMYLTSDITEALGVLVIGGLFVFATLTGQLTHPTGVTELLTFLVLLVRLLPAVKELYRTGGLIAANYPNVDRVIALLRRDDKPFMQNGSLPFAQFQEEIVFQNVSFHYVSAEKTALHNINLVIPKGKTTAIVGRSGVGKTTLIQLLLRIYDPQQGCILIDGTPLYDFQMRSLRQAISVVSQDIFLFNDSALNNIAFGGLGTVSRSAIIHAAKQADAHDFIMALPNGYETQLGERGVRLSGGQRQRIAIARAILRNPQILILDEATNALDNRTEQTIHQAIMQLSSERTVLLISHRLPTVEDADQIVVLKEGQVVEIGDVASLLARDNGEYVRLAGTR